MSRTNTGGQLWKLLAGSNDTPALSPGTTTKWQFNDLPDRCPTGPLAYYVPALKLTITGTVTQPVGGGIAIPKDRLAALLIDSIDWQNAWHGAPLSGDHVLGSNLRVIEFHARGFKFAQRQGNEIPAAAGPYQFVLTIALPASDVRVGVRETSQLALLYQPSNLRLKMAAPEVLDNFSDGALASNLVGQLSAYLDPRQEIVLGTPVEWIQHQVVAGGNAVRIDGFGRETMLSGVEQKAGVLFLAELSDQLGGLFATEDVTEFAMSWRGQQKFTHPDAWFSMMDDAYPSWKTQVAPGAYATSAPNDYNSMPFAFSNQAPNLSNVDRAARLFFPIANAGLNGRLTDLQTAERDETYFLTVSGGFDPGDHLVLAQYVKQWQPTKIADFRSRVLDGGANSLAAYVLGKNYASAGFGKRAPSGKHSLTDDEKTYLALQFAPGA